MISPRHGIGEVVDPFPVVGSQLVEIIVPMGTDSQGIADECPKYGPLRSVLDCYCHAILAGDNRHELNFAVISATCLP